MKGRGGKTREKINGAKRVEERGVLPAVTSTALRPQGDKKRDRIRQGAAISLPKKSFLTASESSS